VAIGSRGEYRRPALLSTAEARSGAVINHNFARSHVLCLKLACSVTGQQL
jgi:hypothetical protein